MEALLVVYKEEVIKGLQFLMKNKIPMRMFLFMILSLVNTSCAIANDNSMDNCLKDEWKETNPSLEEKEFDSKNDFDVNSYSYSCYAFLTPSEINKFISNFKRLVHEGKRIDIANLIRFPLKLSTAETFVSNEGNVKLKSVVINSQEEFIEKYDYIFSNSLKSIISCIELSRMNVDSVNGFSVAHGNLWFNRTFEGDNQRKIRITSISTDDVLNLKWYQQNCDKLKRHP
jgi:hypothetical protein